MTDFDKENMDGSLYRDPDYAKPFRYSGKRKRAYTIEIIDKDLKIHWSGIIEEAKGTKHARDLWRLQYPEIRERFLNDSDGEFMVRVR